MAGGEKSYYLVLLQLLYCILQRAYLKKEVIVGDPALPFFLFGEGFAFLGGGKTASFFVNPCISAGCSSMRFCASPRFAFEHPKSVFLFISKRAIGETSSVGVAGCL